MPFTGQCAGDHVIHDAGGHARLILQLEQSDDTHVGEHARDKLIDPHRSME